MRTKGATQTEDQRCSKTEGGEERGEVDIARRMRQMSEKIVIILQPGFRFAFCFTKPLLDPNRNSEDTVSCANNSMIQAYDDVIHGVVRCRITE